MSVTRIELLAPAKDLESGKIAINAGADALYIGAAKFGARQAVGNSVGDIEQLAKYAHKYWGRVYAVLNTLLYDSEIDEALKLSHQLYEAGVDALIIQDLGLLESDLPPLPLYASTQMHNHTPERVAFLEKVGFQRAILARELSLEQISAIRAATNIEIETFVHGALCVSYSGQCALSYALGGRSGNRGECAQSCRRPYTLKDKKGNALVQNSHLLSLKDLNLSDYLEDLIAAGVTSFKIEGRLKDQAYVKNIVAHYRQRLDTLLPRLGARPASSGIVEHHFQPDPAKTFQRGFTTYFITGERVDMPSFETPKNAGEPIGIVTALDAKTFTLNIPAPLNNGDGLTFFSRAGALMGTLVNGVAGKKITPAKMDGIYIGAQIRRNADRAFLKQLERSKPSRNIRVELHFAESPHGFLLAAQDEDGNRIEIPLKSEKIPAKKKEQALATLKEQLTKLGESDFICTAFSTELSQAYFFPRATLNALRRELVEKLGATRAAKFPRLAGKIIQHDALFPEKKLSYWGNVLNEKAADFYRRHGVDEIEPAAESGLNMKGRKVMTTKHCIKYELGGCPHGDAPVKFTEPLYLVDENEVALRLAFNCKACVMEVYYD